MSVAFFLLFTIALFAATAAAVTGRRGQVCERDIGYTVPAQVEADPELNRRANELVATWCTAAAVLAAVPLVVLAVAGLDRADLPLWEVGALAAWAFVMVCVGGYPFERITHLGRPADRSSSS